MGDFKPSNNFVARTMAEIRAYEVTASHEMEQNGARRLSKAALTALTAAAVLLGIFNLIRFAFIFISPALCL